MGRRESGEVIPDSDLPLERGWGWMGKGTTRGDTHYTQEGSQSKRRSHSKGAGPHSKKIHSMIVVEKTASGHE